MPCRAKAERSCSVATGSIASKLATLPSACPTESCGKACRCLMTDTCSRTEKGYAKSPSRTRQRSSSKAPTIRRWTWGGTLVPKGAISSSCDAASGLSTTCAAKTVPHSLKKSLPRKGKPGRLARVRTRNRSWMITSSSLSKLPSAAAASGERTRRPSESSIWPSASSDLSTATTSSGALSASSSISTWPCRSASTRGLSRHSTAPPTSSASTVRDWTVESRCSCMYWRSSRSSCSSRSASLFLPVPWLPMSSTARSPATRSAARSSRRRRCVGLS
mmetsp:Transcript_8951/g.29302  ORF Transcript_8951/g.29302 Transcript_8951/m.29302 type:complete len:276 (-) Transcript_8951:267-1094(-)